MTLYYFLLLVILPISKSFEQWSDKSASKGYKWKMSFKADITRQAQEVIFSRKSIKANNPPVFLNGIPVARIDWQKHLGMYLDSKLNFYHYIKEKILKQTKLLT